MSLPRYKVTMLALSLGIASALVGCSSNPKKKLSILAHSQANRFISIKPNVRLNVVNILMLQNS